MGTYKTKIVNNIICSKLYGELDKPLVNKWVGKVEEQEAGSALTLNHFYKLDEVAGFLGVDKKILEDISW